MKDQKTVIFINQTKFELDDPVQTGASLKTLASIPTGDALFLQQPGDDLLVQNGDQVTLKNGDHLHSQPAADYGDFAPEEFGHNGQVEVIAHPNGWKFAILHDFEVPKAYEQTETTPFRLLIKLPPTFPDAAPDMFWVSPHLKLREGGRAPKATSTETLLTEKWQRFSWHLKPGSWVPGQSTLRDFVRCVRARFAKGN